MLKQWRCWGAAFVLLGSVGVQADPMQWLERMADSGRELSYRGVLTYQYGQTTEALEISHVQRGGVEYDRLVHLDGEHREIHRFGGQLTCVDPGQRIVRVFPQRYLQEHSLESLAQNYQLSEQGGNRVAGRDVVELELLPKDPYRFGQRFALDRETALLLRVEVVSSRGEVLERFQFSDITLGGEGLAIAAPTSDQVAEQAPTVDPAWRVGWLPPGFASLKRPSLVREQVEVQAFSDGIALFSVFVEPLPDAMPQSGEGRAQRGATMAYSQALQAPNGPVLVTVVGEVPSVTARRVAQHLQWRAAP